MGKVPSIPWWVSIGRIKPQVDPDTDYADMGTAFGLDASMAPADWDEPPDEAPLCADRLNGRSVP